MLGSSIPNLGYCNPFQSSRGPHWQVHCHVSVSANGIAVHPCVHAVAFSRLQTRIMMLRSLVSGTWVACCYCTCAGFLTNDYTRRARRHGAKRAGRDEDRVDKKEHSKISHRGVSGARPRTDIGDLSIEASENASRASICHEARDFNRILNATTAHRLVTWFL